ncbi:MAG: hypothetical protein R3F56_05465 [Planctomycetota bacterium]
MSRAPAASAAREVVILRESEVEDIPSAIRRVRADTATARSQILIIAADGDNAVAEAGEDVPSLPLTSTARVVAMAEAAAVKGWARHVEPLLADLQHLLDESEREAAGLAEDVGEGTRARLQNRARVLAEIGTWTREVANDLSHLVGAAEQGRRPVELTDLWRRAEAEIGDTLGVRFLPESEDAGAVRLELDVAAALDLLVGCARLIAARLRHEGNVRVDITATTSSAVLTLSGMGAGHPVRSPRLVERVRELAASMGVALTAGAGGVHGATVSLAFPRPTP